MARYTFCRLQALHALATAREWVILASPLRFAVHAALCVLAAAVASDVLLAQALEQFLFEPALLVCVLPPSPTPPAPWPVAATDSLVGIAGAPLVFNRATLLANDTGAALTLVRVVPASTAGGTIAGTDPLTYTPPSGFAGNDIFAYEIADSFGQSSTGLVKVSLVVDRFAPTVSIDAPVGGTVSGTVVLRASASDNVAVAGVSFVDGASQIGPADVAAPFEAAWNTTLVPDGSHHLLALARDASGNTASSGITVNVLNTGPPPTTMPAGLVLALGFDETSGTTALDRSASNQHGVVAGATRVPGKVGGALQFDGLDDVVTVADSAALDLTTGMTLSAWVNPSAFTGWETVMLKERGAGALAYGLYAQDGGSLGGGFDAPAGTLHAGGSDHAVRSPSALPLHTWTHLATTYDGTVQRIYVDGLLAATRTQTGSIAVSNGPFRIGGNNSWADEFFEGVIDEVRVYNRALSATEIATDMNMGALPAPTPPGEVPPPGIGLVAAYSFNEGSGTAITDVSGNGRNGTLRGAVFAAGKSGTALRFDGVDDWVTVPDGVTGSPLDLTTGMTLSAWVHPLAFTGWETILMKERGAGAMAYALYAQDGGTSRGGVDAPAGTIRAGAGDQAVRGITALPRQAWTHVATTYDGAIQQLYVNGILVASRAQTGSIAASNGALRIGGNSSWADEFFNGLIDDVRVYNRALTGAQITADMNTPLP